MRSQLTHREWIGLAFSLTALLMLVPPLLSLTPTVALELYPRLVAWSWVPIAIWLWSVTRRRLWLERRWFRTAAAAGVTLVSIPLCGLSALATLFSGGDTTVVTDTSPGQHALYLVQDPGFFLGRGSCVHAEAGVYGGLFRRAIGESHCYDYEGYAGFSPRSFRFERFPKQGLAALVGDAEDADAAGAGIYLELFQLDRLPHRLSTKTEGEPEFGSPEHDEAIRNLLSAAGAAVESAAP